MNSLAVQQKSRDALHCAHTSYIQIAEELVKIKEGSRVNPRKRGNHL